MGGDGAARLVDPDSQIRTQNAQDELRREFFWVVEEGDPVDQGDPVKQREAAEQGTVVEQGRPAEQGTVEGRKQERWSREDRRSREGRRWWKDGSSAALGVRYNPCVVQLLRKIYSKRLAQEQFRKNIGLVWALYMFLIPKRLAQKQFRKNIGLVCVCMIGGSYCWYHVQGLMKMISWS